MTDEPINIQQFHRDYIETLSRKERQAIRQSHLKRMRQGRKIWNAWAEQVLEAIEKTYPENASEAEKLAIRNQYQIDFSKVEFKEDVDFFYFIFPIAVDFSRATFSGEANFKVATFSGEANFKVATFSGEANFKVATFSGKANFMLARFSSNARFFGVTFSGEANFRVATFSGEANFEEVTFSCEANFLRAIFSGEMVSFLGAEFQRQSLFIGVQFADTAKAIPCDFRQVDFHLPPLVDSFPSNLSQFIDANINKQRDQGFYQDCEAKFRALKQLAEGNNNHQKALEFYSCELYCQRHATGGLRNLKNWASYFYGWLSGYGLSLLRPFILWLAVILGGIVLQACNDNKISLSPTASVNWERVFFYAAPSMSALVSKPLYQKEVRHRLYPEDTEKTAGQLPPFNRVVRFFQTLLTFVALFLVGLALRNRFKIK